MKLSNHCFAVTGLHYFTPWSVNAGFIAGGKKTLVIDAGGSSAAAQTIHGYASAAKPDNELILINTEKHLDHIGGNGYFQTKGIPIYGHRLIHRTQEEFLASIDEENAFVRPTARKLNNEAAIPFKGTQIVDPDHPIDQDMELDLGGCSVRILLTPGHTNTNLCVCHEQDRVVYTGDSVIADILPNMEDGTPRDWALWLKSLETIQRLHAEILVPGHGNVLFGRNDIDNEIQRMRTILERAIGLQKAPTAEG
jgi:glyoxylase-like metal-dependent hydrolase (beta-lactamase superfamily II)